MDVINLKCKFFNCVYKDVVAAQYNVTCLEDCDVLANYIFYLENEGSCTNTTAYPVIDDTVTLPSSGGTTTCSSTITELLPIATCDNTSSIQEL